MDTIRLGATGPDVELAQLALYRAGWLPSPPDGIFGPITLAAVIRFQRAYGLTQDGVAGPNTWEKLRPFLAGYARRTVRQGDSFFKLAQEFYTTIQAIKTANPNADPDRLQIGQQLIIPYGFDVVPTNIRYTSELVGLIAEGLSARYPYITVGSIGNSVMGKKIYSLTIGEGSRKVGYNASHHANEWITTPLVLLFLERYAKAQSTGETIGGVSGERLSRDTTLTVVPLVNPDGVDLVNGAINSGEYYQRARRIAENFPRIPFPSGWKANIKGTDLNLNYPAGWEEAKAIKYAQGYDRPAPRDYVGEEPLSAPESAAMAELTRQQNFALTLSYHTQGEVIFWKYLNIEPAGSYQLALRMGEVSGYSVESVPTESGYAGYKDWFILTFDRPGYTIEAGRGTNPLPLNQLHQMYEKNLGIFILGLEG